MGNCVTFQLPFLREAFNLCRKKQLQSAKIGGKSARDDVLNSILKDLAVLESNFAACMHNHVACRASIRQGCGLATTAAATFDHNEELKALQHSITTGRHDLQGHVPIIFGAVMAFMDISVEESEGLFVFNLLRSTISAAVRQGIVGSLQGQRLQFTLRDTINKLLAEHAELRTEDAFISFPLIEHIQASHDLLFSKMFYS